jgi:hypothetical protein
MSRVCTALSWLLVFPYAYIVFFLGNMVSCSAKTPQAAAIVFWAYLAAYPVSVLVCWLIARRWRAAGKAGRALAASLVPYGVLAVGWTAFAPFVGLLCAVFG